MEKDCFPLDVSVFINYTISAYIPVYRYVSMEGLYDRIYRFRYYGETYGIEFVEYAPMGDAQSAAIVRDLITIMAKQ